MPYSDEQRQAALDCLAASGGDFQQASAATGISPGTLRRWARQEPSASYDQELTALVDQLAAYKQHLLEQPMPDNPLERGGTVLMLSMLENAILLSESIQPVITDAPLNQRATALSQIIDKAIRLSKELPQTGEQVIRVEFIDPDGTAHPTPYWSRGHSDQRGAL